MIEFDRVPRLRSATALLLLGSVGLMGCSNSSEGPRTNRIMCTADTTPMWTAVPGNFDVQAIGNRLGVSAEEVRQGSFGGANCDTEITPEDLTGGGVQVEVRNVGKVCLAVGFQTQPLDQPHKDILAVCAKQEAGA